MNMNLYRIFVPLILSTLASSIYAQAPTQQQIVAWISNPERSNASPARSIQIDRTEEIKLMSGEVAYLSAIEFNNAGRNFWAGYILTRPTLKQSQILNFGGQSNTFNIHPTYYKDKQIQLIEFESAGSGQGVIEASKTMVVFQNWKAIELAELQQGSSDGFFDDESNDTSCKSGWDNSGFFNVMPYAPYIIETTLTGDACDNKPQGYSVKTRLIEIKLP